MTMRFGLVSLGVASLVALMLFGCRDDEPEDPRPETPGVSKASFVGSDRCLECHPDEGERHRGSHHDLSLQRPTAESVLGDWSGAHFETDHLKATFRREADRFFVDLDEPGVEARKLPVVYTFGIEPIQQVLLEGDRGRLQAFTVAWHQTGEARSDGHWFSLQPDEVAPPGDELHWAGPHYTWNRSCARCHSTGFERRYDPASDAYASHFAEEDVSCEACHGPGSLHVAAAGNDAESLAPSIPPYGLEVDVRGQPTSHWVLTEDSPTAIPRSHVRRDSQLLTCARCHSRRSEISPEVPAGQPYLDGFLPALLEEGLYFADGQIQDEVFVHGSFLQSKMHAKGVTCTDCHDAHTTRTLTTGNGLCYRCHKPDVFDVPSHHHHPVGSPGAECVACHMPERTYMGFDSRRDHSLRVPRPDLSPLLESPNACNGCHDDESPGWAAKNMDSWYGLGWRKPHYGSAIHAGREHAMGASNKLVATIVDADTPPIAKGTALFLLAMNDGSAFLHQLKKGMPKDDLVALGAAQALAFVDPGEVAQKWVALARHERRAVRFECARTTLEAPLDGLSNHQEMAIRAARSEFEAQLMARQDDAAALMGVAELERTRGRLDAAANWLELVVKREPWREAAWVNLSNVAFEQSDETRTLEVLDDGLRRLPNAAALHHARGLSLIRQNRRIEARAALLRAHELAPMDARYGYVYGVSLIGAGDRDAGLQVLRVVHARVPGDRDTLRALLSYALEERDRPAARTYATKLLKLQPGDQRLLKLLEGL